MAVPLTMEERIEELIADARKVVEAGEQALAALARRDPQGACNTIAVAHYPIGYVHDHRAHILEQFELDGITPGLK